MTKPLPFFAYSKLKLILCVLLCASCNAQINGLWYWTWSSGVNVGDTNLGVAFSGWADPAQAISDSTSVINSLPGTKYIALGGGNSNGYWTIAILQKVSSYCSSNSFQGYSGLVFDVEEGDSGLSSQFESTFAACKSSGYKILITVSHSAPYGISDAASVMQSFFSNQNIDYLSPQLYTSGTEQSNDFTTAGGVQWSSYAQTSAQIIPSIVTGSLYPNAQSYFSGVGVKTVGYVQWSQTVTSAGNPPSSGSGSTVRCGSDWSSANSACGAACATNNDCPSGQYCYASLNACAGSSSSTVRCGSDWSSANSGCGATCATNNDCLAGQYCYASLNACGASAISDNGQVLGDTSPANGMTLTPLQIGLIAGGCCVVVVVIVIIAVVAMQKKKIEERA